jgi:hypothetical protein
MWRKEIGKRIAVYMVFLSGLITIYGIPKNIFSVMFCG